MKPYQYHIKKTVFMLLAHLLLFNLLYWFLFDLGEISQTGANIRSLLDMETYFRSNSDIMMIPLFYSCIVVPLASIIYLIFYRKECTLWLKIAILATSFMHAFFAAPISRNVGRDSAFEWKILLGIFLICALVSAIWLMIEMSIYTKKASKEV